MFFGAKKNGGEAPKDSRSGEAPMDFEYSNGTGPIDPQSPFIGFANRPNIFQESRKRPFDGYKAPDEFPSLRAPTGQTTFFSDMPPRSSSPEKPLPKLPKKSLFNTPRAPKPVIDSSPLGPESPQTPTRDGDSEDTPELFSKKSSPKKMPSYASATQENKTSPKKPGFWNRLTPTRKSPSKVYTRKAESRIIKRREKNKSSRSKSEAEDLETDTDAEKKKISHRSLGFVQGTLAPIFRIIEDHPNVPGVLINYLQVMSNLAFFMFVVYLAWSMWAGIVGDVNRGVMQSMIEARREIQDCDIEWRQLNCENPTRSAVDLCLRLTRCREQDAGHIARGQVSARTFAAILNEFAEQISWKAMLFYFMGFTIFIVCNNLTWNGLRSKFTPEQYQYSMNPLATPHRHPSSGMYPQTPHQLGGYYPNHYLHSPAKQSQIEPGPSHIPENRRIMGD